MQIRAFNAINTTAVQSIQRNSTLAQANNNMFAPQCKVTISKEGKRLSRQQAQQPQKSAQGTAVQRMLLRQREENEQNDEIIDGYRKQLKDIEDNITSLNKSFSRAPKDRETIEKEQEVLKAMRDQKQAQMEENQKCAKDAQSLAAMLSAESQEDIDRNNRELWTLLKTLEEAEKAEEEREGGDVEDDSGSAAPQAGSSVSDAIQNSATKFATASMRRELNVKDKLEGLGDEGHRLVKIANDITNNILMGIEDATAALDDENYTDDMRAKLVNELQEGAKYDYLDVERYRNNGLYLLQKERDLKIQRIADNPLAGMQETKDSMMMSAANAVLGEARQSHLDAASKELADEVKKLLDERNSVDKTPEEKEEDEKEKEQVEDSKELTDTNTEPQTKKEEDSQAETLEELIQEQE